MNIRSVKLSDYSLISQLLHNALTEEDYDATIEALGRQLSWDSDLVLVAEKDEHIVGIVIGTIDNNKGYVYRIAVAEDYQRQGIGTNLVVVLKNRFEQRQVKKVIIATEDQSDFSASFFMKLGYATSDFLTTPIQKLSIVSG